MKKIVLSIVLYGFSWCYAGSFEDYFSAIKRNDPPVVQRLLQRGFDANTRNEAGEHGLFLALKGSATGIARMLMDTPKIDLEARNAKDESALMIAVLKGFDELAQALIDKGADVNKPGWTPLHYAATAGNVPLINLLLEHDAYIDASSPNESTPLMMAAMYGTPSAVKTLLEAGADPTIVNGAGLTALDFARGNKKPESAQIIDAFVRGRQASQQ
jgi:ankyrin repeat protein